MIDFAYYLMKVTICSGIFFLYYLFALRNKLFHQWNRFYLLIAVVLSLAAPLLQFTIWHQFQTRDSQAIELLKIVGSANSYLDEVTVTGQSSLSFNWIILVYASVSLVLLTLLCISLINIFLLVKTHSVSLINRIKFVNTDAKGTPFSFLRFIFWNRQIDIQSETGQQIFQHELVHVNEKHTMDKLFMQIVIILFWCNPFFWMIRRELKLIHEFIADKKAIAEHGTAALAAMILQSAYPSQFNSITNQFFQTSIKRRLAMLSKIQHPRINYISRLIALPILAITVFAFTLRTKNTDVPNIALQKTFTVVIDAGHGMQGDHYTGASSGNVSEDQIAYAISNKIKELNTNDKIKIVFSRTSEQLTDLQKIF
jgi:beta-lactamase regulating signal transducer with metallopeptidase domain